MIFALIACLLLAGCVQTDIAADGSGAVTVQFELVGGQIQPTPQTSCENLRPNPIFLASVFQSQDSAGGTSWFCQHKATFQTQQELNALYDFYGATVNQFTTQNNIFTYEVDLQPTSPHARTWQVTMPGQLIPGAHNATYTTLDETTGRTILTWLRSDTCGAASLGAQSTLSTFVQGETNKPTDFLTMAAVQPCMEITQPVVNPLVGDLFAIDLFVNTGEAVADTIVAALDFDPAFLQVTEVTYPNSLGSYLLADKVDNVQGQIDISLARFTNPYFAGSFRAATIHLQTVATTDTLTDGRTQVTFLHNSDLLRNSLTLAPTLAESNIRIVAADGQPRNLNGKAPSRAFQPPNLYRACEGFLLPGVRAYEPGTDKLVGIGYATPEPTGTFQVRVNDITAGTQLSGVFDVQVKGNNTLSNKRRVSLPTADGVAIDFGELLLGDANGDDRVDMVDVSYVIPALYTAAGYPGFNACADITHGGYVNQFDISTLLRNFNKAGPNPTASSQHGQTAMSNGASLSLRMVQPAQADQVAIEIVADTGSIRVDTVAAHLDFDPQIVEVRTIEIAPGIFDENTTYRSFDNESGRVNVAGTKLEQHALTGTFSVATVHFRVLQEATIPPVELAHSQMQKSDMADGGVLLNADLKQLPPPLPYRVFIPTTLR